MIYPADFETKIGFSPIRDALKEKCLGSAARSLADRMAFSADFGKVKYRLTVAHQMQSFLMQGIDIPLLGHADLEPLLAQISPQGTLLSTQQLTQLQSSLKTVALTAQIPAQYPEQSESSPELCRLMTSLDPHPEVARAIDAVLDSNGSIRDNASPALAEIRVALMRAQNSLNRTLSSIMAKAQSEGYIEPGTSPSIRDGRLVIPVPAAKHRSIGGIIHDQSASGKTYFIEPEQIVRANNEIRSLISDEEREITRILMSVADTIRPHIPTLTQTHVTLSRIDFIRAKALFAIETGGQMPHLHKSMQLEWYGAVHPTLLASLRAKEREIVPLNITLTAKDRILIISGPNAGGKSVTLKTVGVVQYMMQCGLLPTLHDNSHMSMFHNIYVDIGDQQSIENDLSTYSSHLRAMKYFISHSADPKRPTLILADEMGSGTEPQIGGAIAQAIIRKLNEHKTFAVITTHYQNLKTFADETPGLVNGAMLYDRQNLRPTYQLAIGSPGSSFALEIAYKTGLPNDIIEDARSIVGSDYTDMDKYLMSLARDRKYWAEKRLSVKQKEQQLDKAIEKANEKSEQLSLKRKEILEDARAQALEIMQGANAAIERTIHDIRKAQAEKQQTQALRSELRKYHEQLKAAADTAPVPEILAPSHNKTKKKKPASQHPTPETYSPKVGDYVRITSDGPVGRIEKISGNNAEITFGNIRTKTKTDKLVPAQAPKKTSAAAPLVTTATTEQIRNRQLGFNPDIDIRGMRVDEALQAITYFIDDALQFGAKRVRILHGTGTGALRQAIRQLLSANSAVTNFADEDVRLGGAGITVIDLP